MDWFRGGKWQPYEDGDGRWLASPMPVVSRTALFQADPYSFFARRDQWCSQISAEFDLKVYSPSAKDLRQIAEFAEKLSKRFRRPQFADYVPPKPKVTHALLNFLEKFGPLGEIPGVLELEPRWKRPPDPDRLNKAVNLQVLFLELQELGRKLSEAIRFRNGKQAIPAWASAGLDSRGLEYRTVPRYSHDRIVFEAIPRTLGVLLHTYLLSLAHRPIEASCRFCQHQFTVPLQRGRPTQYCARHKAPKFRKIWQRGNAERYCQQYPMECLSDADHVAPGAG